MSERLTKELLGQWLKRGGETERMIDGMWERIEADREAVREETREEVLKDHFKIGEQIKSLHGKHAMVMPVLIPSTEIGDGTERWWRFSKGHAMTELQVDRVIEQLVGLHKETGYGQTEELLQEILGPNPKGENGKWE